MEKDRSISKETTPDKISKQGETNKSIIANHHVSEPCADPIVEAVIKEDMNLNIVDFNQEFSDDDSSFVKVTQLIYEKLVHDKNHDQLQHDLKFLNSPWANMV